MKSCSRCRLQLPITSFRLDKCWTRYICKKCEAQKTAAWKKENPEKAKKHSATNSQKYSATFRANHPENKHAYYIINDGYLSCRKELLKILGHHQLLRDEIPFELIEAKRLQLKAIRRIKDKRNERSKVQNENAH